MGVVGVGGACGSGQCGSGESTYPARTKLSVQSQYPGRKVVLTLCLYGFGTKVWALLPKEGLGDWINTSGLDKGLERPSKPLPAPQLQGTRGIPMAEMSQPKDLRQDLQMHADVTGQPPRCGS